MIDFVPLHLSALDREPKFKGWLGDLLSGLDVKWMTPENWFEAPELGRGTFVWTPPPAATDVVVDQLGKTKLREPGSLHLVVVPRLMTGRWRRLLTRGTDCYGIIKWEDVWDLKTHFEPLILFVSLPLNVSFPNHTGRLKWMEKYHGLLQSVSQVLGEKERSGLRQLFGAAWKL